ncbi:protein-(glutamine-N5) methyltransferase, release factor-specific [Candidatus Saccharibacteria bacterium 32-49-12]|nr:MAG: protein-(glutamine-N5) methyltransferase, release factor-specific [Candidatus Saccharibacteria bacterium 32-49-12]
MNENLPPPAPAINDWLIAATRRLSDIGIATARLDAELILAHTLRVSRTYLHAHGDDNLDDRQLEIANARLDLRLDRVPVAYITGHKEFYGKLFHVTTATLIPRPESESLIDLLRLALLETPTVSRLVDVGTGSGALGITAARLFTSLDVTLIDNSHQALVVAEKNLHQQAVEARLLHSDLLEDYSQTADIIMANLPYVDRDWERSPETDHEPAEALFASKQGLALIERLILQTPNKLAINGHLILEADPVQHRSIIEFAKNYNLQHRQTEGYGVWLQKLR